MLQDVKTYCWIKKSKEDPGNI